MSTTEDYLDQLLRSASGEENDDTGELDSALQSEENIIPLENDIEEPAAEEGLSLEQAMEMSVDDVLAEMESIGDVETEPVVEEPLQEEAPQEEVPQEEMLQEEIIEPLEESNGMMSEEAIAAMFAANESTESESEPEESVEEPLQEETLPEEPLQEEALPEETPQEAVLEPEMEESNGMMSEEAIAAMFAANESTESEPEPEESVEEPLQEEALQEEVPQEEEPAEEIIEPLEFEPEISLDDMLADMREEDFEAVAEETPIVLEKSEVEVGEPEETESESPTEAEGDDSILDLLNMMSEDEDLKDIGDLLKSDEDTDFDIADDELFGEPPTEEETPVQEAGEKEEKEEKQGFFAKLFGKKKGEKQEAETDENEQIIKEVEEEIKEEDKKAEEKEKKKKKKDKKDKKGKKKGKEGEKGQEGEEDQEAEDGKKGKKAKKKKEKPPKVKEIAPKEPPLPKKPVILIMLMAASILALVLLSHKVIDYQLKISKADSLFINRNYEEAYENILGVNVKEEDKQLYDRIRVMMKLEAKYKMYLSHIEQNRYDEALNDLIMGVIKYDQYKKNAEELGIQQAFDDELALMEEQLNVVFGVDANQARDWYNRLSALDYTETVRSVVKAAGYSVEEPEENVEETSGDLSQFGVEEVE